MHNRAGFIGGGSGSMHLGMSGSGVRAAAVSPPPPTSSGSPAGGGSGGGAASPLPRNNNRISSNSMQQNAHGGRAGVYEQSGWPSVDGYAPPSFSSSSTPVSPKRALHLPLTPTTVTHTHSSQTHTQGGQTANGSLQLHRSASHKPSSSRVESSRGGGSGSSSSRSGQTASSAASHAVAAASSNTVSAVPKGEWQQDSSARRCHHCSIKFTLLTRKHHCRSCGLIHCDNCSKYRSTIPHKNYHDRVRVCGKCYYAIKKQKKAAAAGGGREGGGSGHQSRHRTLSGNSRATRPSASSTAATAAAVAAAELSANEAAELRKQLSALHSLHTSYQPEHHYLTSLLSNASQLEQVYVATIQTLYTFVQGQAAQHQSELRARDLLIEQQRRQIEQMEEAWRQAGYAVPSSNNLMRAGSSVPTLPPRASSPLLSHMSAPPSSRASPAFQSSNHAMMHNKMSQVNGQTQQQANNPSSHPQQQQPSIPPLPTTFINGNSGYPSHLASSPTMYHPQSSPFDASSEYAYLDMPRSNSSSIGGGSGGGSGGGGGGGGGGSGGHMHIGQAQMSMSMGAGMGLGMGGGKAHSSRHPSHTHSHSQSSLPSLTLPLSVTEPPSPPRSSAGHLSSAHVHGSSSVGGGGGSNGLLSGGPRLKRASSNPTIHLLASQGDD